jgi:hypothetical protein
MSAKRVSVPLRSGSDGDPTHVPTAGSKTQVDPPALYLEKIGQQWIEARGQAQEGVTFVLENLPAGYTMWERPRASNPKHWDKYLYGHPRGRPFDSPNRFYPHFAFLMENGGSNIGCPCTLCAGSGGVLPKSSSNSSRMRSSSRVSSQSPNAKASSGAPPPKPTSKIPPYRPSTATASTASKPHPVVSERSSVSVTAASTMSAPTFQVKGRPKLAAAGMDSSRVDEEGTPDVYRNLIDKLKRCGTIDETIEEPLSPDWLADQNLLPSLRRVLRNREQWMPRAGDVILYIRDLPDNVAIRQHETSGEYQLFDEDRGEPLGIPPWEAGLVAQIPETPSTIASLYEPDTEESVIYSGVRVEPIPNPNETDKSCSKHHKYVSLRQTRPLVLWKELLGHVPQDRWHATIINALTTTSNLSLMGKYRFRGLWPKADIYCHGLYLGSEMLAVGDTVRLSPSVSKNHSRCTEVLVIKTIRLKWLELDKASNNDYDDGRPYGTEVWVYGSAYTSDPLQMNKEYLSETNSEPPRAAAGYGEWYPLHPATKELAVPYSRVMGRLYERDAMEHWLSTDPAHPPDLNVGREALIEARAFSRKHDRRISEQPGTTWYWGDDRADGLNIHTINGLETAKHDTQRDIRDLRKNIKVMDAMRSNAQGAAKSAAPVSLANRSLRHFMAPGTGAVPDQTQDAPGTNENGSTDGSSSGAASTVASKKRPYVVNLSDEEDSDEEEEEFRQHTKIMDDGVEKKKTRVEVVIG